MENWIRWLDPEYAFANNGEKIKRFIKTMYYIGLILTFIGAFGAFFWFLVMCFEGGVEYFWYVPFLIVIEVILAPYLLYINYAITYGIGEIISNSYKPDSQKQAERDAEGRIKYAYNTQTPASAPFTPAPQQESNPSVPPVYNQSPTFAQRVNTTPAEENVCNIHISYYAEGEAPEYATYSINESTHVSIRSGETRTERIRGEYYDLKFIAGRFKAGGTYLASPDAKRTFICTKKKLEEK